MCWQSNKQAWCRHGTHYFGEVTFLRYDRCWEVRDNLARPVGSCTKGISEISSPPFQDPVVVKCETCEAKDAEEAAKKDAEGKPSGEGKQKVVFYFGEDDSENE